MTRWCALHLCHLKSHLGSGNLFRGQSSLQHLHILNILITTTSSPVPRRIHWRYRFRTRRKILLCRPCTFLPRSWHRLRFLALLFVFLNHTCYRAAFLFRSRFRNPSQRSFWKGPVPITFMRDISLRHRLHSLYESSVMPKQRSQHDVEKLSLT